MSLVWFSWIGVSVLDGRSRFRWLSWLQPARITTLSELAPSFGLGGPGPFVGQTLPIVRQEWANY